MRGKISFIEMGECTHIDVSVGRRVLNAGHPRESAGERIRCGIE